MNVGTNLVQDRISCFSETYEQARFAFRKAASKNPSVSLLDSITITAKGYSNEPLSIDIAWLGNLSAKKILIHISGTHGVEGFAGSAIANSLLNQPIDMDEDTAIIFVHALNPYGMALNRRVNENNVDLNRNFTDQRQTHPLYAKIDHLINPPCHAPWDFFHLKALAYLLWYGSSNVMQAIAGGQYHFPEGLFYGGTQVEEGPQKLLAWFEDKLSAHPFKEDIRFGLIDVHTGLGPKGRDFLLALNDNLKRYLQIHSGGDLQDKQVGYTPQGMFLTALEDSIRKATRCASERIASVGQEFGTYSNYRVFMSLRDENSAYHEAKRKGHRLNPLSSESQAVLRVFYPDHTEREWRLNVIQRGRSLVEEMNAYLKKLSSTD